jgi:histidyl-tRNA synthetase
MAEAPVMSESLCGPCREHFDTVRTLLRAERVDFVENPRLVRGLDYYCRTAFEVVSGGLGAQNAVGGGGRYDGLVAALGGPDVPGVGFALGLERLAMVTPSTGAAAEIAAVVLPLEERAVGPALSLATRLRAADVSVTVEAPGRSLKALLRGADRRGARLAVILGGDELAAGRATVRDLVAHADRRDALPLDASPAALAAVLRDLLAVPAGT